MGTIREGGFSLELSEESSPITFTQQSRLCHEGFVLMWSNDKRFRICWHDGPATNEDRENEGFNRQLWEEEYLLRYHAEMRKLGIPEKYWIE